MIRLKNTTLSPGFRKLALVTLCCMYVENLMAGENGMAEAIRESGKIYVVVGVVVLIFIGLVIYLARLDRKINKLESFQKKDKSTE